MSSIFPSKVVCFRSVFCRLLLGSERLSLARPPFCRFEVRGGPPRVLAPPVTNPRKQCVRDDGIVETSSHTGNQIPALRIRPIFRSRRMVGERGRTTKPKRVALRETVLSGRRKDRL